MEGSTLDLYTIIMGAEGAFISLLIGVVGYFHVVNTKSQNNRMNKHEDFIEKLSEQQAKDSTETKVLILKQQEQISVLAQRMDSIIEVIKQNQKGDSDRLQFLEKLIVSGNVGKLKPARA